MLSRSKGHEVKSFLIGDAAACAKAHQKVPLGYDKLEVMLTGARGGVELGVCGTCMDARGNAEEELVEGASRSTLAALTDCSGPRRFRPVARVSLGLGSCGAGERPRPC